MRKRLIFETLHLDVEGGVGERRTTPATTAIAMDEASHSDAVHHRIDPPPRFAGAATIQVQVEEKMASIVATHSALDLKEASAPSAFSKKSKPKKKVAFHSERPDLYDF